MRVYGVTDDFFDDFKKEAKKRYSEKEYKDFEESVKLLKETEIGYFGVVIYSYKAQKSGETFFFTELSAVWFPDVQESYSILTKENPKLENIKNFISKFNSIKVGDEI